MSPYIPAVCVEYIPAFYMKITYSLYFEAQTDGRGLVFIDISQFHPFSHKNQMFFYSHLYYTMTFSSISSFSKIIQAGEKNFAKIF